MSKRYRVSQYDVFGLVGSRDYRFKWWAKWIAYLYSGRGTGIKYYEMYRTEVTKIGEGSNA